MDRKIGGERVCSSTVARWEGDESRTSGEAGSAEATWRKGTESGGLEMTLLVLLDQPRMNERKWIHTGVVKGIHKQSSLARSETCRPVDGWPGKVDAWQDRVGSGWVEVGSDLLRNDSMEGGIAVR